MAELTQLLWPTSLPLGQADEALLSLGVIVGLLIWIQGYPLSTEAWERRLSASSARSSSVWSAHTRAVMLERLTGAALLFFGALIAASALGLSTDWLGLPHPTTSLLWGAGSLVLLLPFVIRAATQAPMMARYPEIREARWTRELAGESIASSAVYLLGYEAFFRGLLTCGLVSILGPWPGLSLATAVYVTQHLRKPAAEAFACLPMGFFFGLMTLQTGSIWAAWVVHLLVAATNEVLSARANPEIGYPLRARAPADQDAQASTPSKRTP